MEAVVETVQKGISYIFEFSIVIGIIALLIGNYYNFFIKEKNIEAHQPPPEEQVKIYNKIDNNELQGNIIGVIGIIIIVLWVMLKNY